MRRFLLSFLLICLIFSAVSCGKGSASTDKNKADAETLSSKISDESVDNSGTNEPTPVEVFNSVNMINSDQDEYPIATKTEDGLYVACSDSLKKISEKDGSVLDTYNYGAGKFYNGVLALGNYIFMHDSNYYGRIYDYKNKKEMKDTTIDQYFCFIHNFAYMGDKIIIAYYHEGLTGGTENISVDVRKASDMGVVVDTIIKEGVIVSSNKKIKSWGGMFYKNGKLYFQDQDFGAGDDENQVLYSMDLKTKKCKEIYRTGYEMEHFYIDDDYNLYFWGRPDKKNAKGLKDDEFSLCRYNLKKKEFDKLLFKSLIRDLHISQYFVLDGYIYYLEAVSGEDFCKMVRVPVSGGEKQLCCDYKIEKSICLGDNFSPCVYGDYIYFPIVENEKHFLGRYDYKKGTAEKINVEL